MKILVINAGSSSLKYQLIDMDAHKLMAKGTIERIAISGSNLVHKYDGKKFVLETPIANHTEAMNIVMAALTDKDHGVISDIKEIGAVGHRVLHGGMKFTKSCIVDDACKAAIRECFPLGPLHNPANLMGIEACEKAMPGVPQVAVFDTAFHQTMPEKAYLYAIPMEYYRKHAIRRYGFHGTSHRYVSGRAVKLMGLEHSRIIVCHLGNGSSLSAVVDGKCVDTSMGLTPLEGVVMGTRSGSLDPAIVEFLASQENLSAKEVITMLNKRSGLLGLSEFSSDMRDVLYTSLGKTIQKDGKDYTPTADEVARCKVTIDCWQYAIRKTIGAYAAAMGGLDGLVFTAGIGENNPILREMLTDGLQFLGVKVDHDKNFNAKDETNISAEGATVQTWVIPTDEEMAIASDTLELVTK